MRGDGARFSPPNLASFFLGSAFQKQLRLRWKRLRFQLRVVALGGAGVAQERPWLPAVARLWVTLGLAQLSAARLSVVTDSLHSMFTVVSAGSGFGALVEHTDFKICVFNKLLCPAEAGNPHTLTQ